MGWYIRKSWKLGPFRLNLSKSGLGWSVGTKGARVGSGPRGDYLHMGRGGLYYRQSLSKKGGESLPEDSEPVRVFCTFCGENNSASARFCIGCGKAVEEAPASTSQSEGKTSPKGTPPWLKLCSACVLFAIILSLAPFLVRETGESSQQVTASGKTNVDIRQDPAFRALTDTQHLDIAESILQRAPSQITAEQFSLAANHIAAVNPKLVSKPLKKRADKLAARLGKVAALRNR